jgi:cytochrome c556
LLEFHAIQIIPMKKITILLTLSISLLASSVFRSVAADEKKDESAIGKVMKDHFKGDTSDIKKATKGELSKDEVTKLLAALKTLPTAKPSKGESASWKEKSEALVLAGEKLEKGDAGAGDAVKAAANCKSCHDAHRAKK